MCNFCFLLLIFLFRGLFLLLIQQAFFKGPLQRVLHRVLRGRLLSYLKKRKISRNTHSLLLVAIRCHSLYHSLSFVVICCHSLSLVVIRCYLLSLVVPLVVIRCHSLSLDVPLVCLFIDDLNRVALFLQSFCFTIELMAFQANNIKLCRSRQLLLFNPFRINILLCAP